MSGAVEVNQDSVKEVLSLFEFVGGNAKNAIRVAINKTLPLAKTASSKGIRAELKISAREVGKKLTVQKAASTKLEGRIKASAKGRLLSHYSTITAIKNDSWSSLSPPAVPPRGIRVEVAPGQRKIVKGSRDGSGSPFYIILPGSKTVAIAQRRKTAGPNGGTLKILYGPSVSQGFQNIKEDVPADTIYQEKMLESINYLLRKQYPQ